METKQLLQSLCDACQIGSVREATKIAKEYLSRLGTVTEDAMGNLQCVFGQGPKVMLDAHLDEIGFIVTAVEDGFLRVAKCGGIDPRTIVGKEVIVHSDIPVHGVFTSVPPHLQKNGDAAPELEHLLIDCGAPSETMTVKPGDFVTFAPCFVMLHNDRCAAKSLDNRAGVTAVLLAAEQLKNCGKQVCVNLSTQEELGLRGATVSAFAFQPETAVVVDVSFGDGCQIPQAECGRLSGGPMIGVSPVLDAAFSTAMQRIAEQNKIPYQLEAMGGKTSTNADVISVSRTGVRTALVSIPLRNMHTAAEVVDLKDIEHTARLIAAFLEV